MCALKIRNVQASEWSVAALLAALERVDQICFEMYTLRKEKENGLLLSSRAVATTLEHRRD